MTLYHETHGEGPALLLLHGWGMHSGIWQGIASRLANHHRLTLVDLPGHGHSPLLAGAYDLDGLVNGVAPIVREDSTLLGWSLGALVAMELARRYPQRVRRLILVGSTPQFYATDDWSAAMPAATLAEFAHELQTDPDKTLRRFLALQVRGSHKASQVLRALQGQFAQRQAARPAALQGGLEILRQTNLRPHLQQIRCPVLLLHGDRDYLTPLPVAKALCRQLPAAKLRAIAGAGHAPFLSHPDDVVQDIDAFTHVTTAS